MTMQEWPAYTQAERATMVFDDECRITRDPDRDARVLWTGLVRADGPPVGPARRARSYFGKGCGAPAGSGT